MTDLEDGGEAVLGITGTWHTLHASGVEWRHHARLLEAFEIGTTPPPGSSGESVRISSSSGSPGPDEGNQPWSIWIERPTLKRAEFMVGDESVIVIFHGHTWWSWSPSRGAHDNIGRIRDTHGLGPSTGLLETQLLSRSLHLKELSRGTMLGRDVIHLRGSPRATITGHDHFRMMQALHPMGLGADEYRFALDAQQGVLLRSEARRASRPFLVLEMTEVRFDEHFDADMFAPESLSM
jgi:outer membrane lipoprotein-sorting protein